MMNGEQLVDIMVEINNKQKSHPAFVMGTCRELNTGTRSVFVELDTAETPRYFPALTSTGMIESGQRVLMARVGSNYVVLGTIRF